MLAQSGRVGQRVQHPVMDTDPSPALEYFVLMSFASREQCDEAVDAIFKAEKPIDEPHSVVLSQICEPVFTCWQDCDFS